MKLEEKHKEFVVKCFARFMTLTQIVDAFMEEFEDDLPPPDIPDLLPFEEWMGDPIPDEDDLEKQGFIEDFTRNHQKAYKEKYGDEADERFNQDLLEAYQVECERDYAQYCEILRRNELPQHHAQLRNILFNRFRRLDIDHVQFPDKYKALFSETRDEFCKNYRIPDLNVPENVVRELETLYGYERQRIFQHSNSKNVTKHVTLAHQILKTIIACNAINTGQAAIDVTPQDVKKALKKAQKLTTD